MKPLPLLYIFVLMSIGLWAQTPQKKEMEDPNWTPFFDGKTFNGWHAYGQKGNQAITGWEIVNGQLHSKAGAKHVDLVSDTDLGDFQLRFEWQLAPKANTGVVVYVHEKKGLLPTETGPEIQIIDPVEGVEAKVPKRNLCDVYDLIPAYQPNVNLARLWNITEIVCINGKAEVYLNGKRTTSFYLWTSHWKQAIANSKFSKLAGFGLNKRGKIVLLHQGDEAWFRNIQIKKW